MTENVATIARWHVNTFARSHVRTLARQHVRTLAGKVRNCSNVQRFQRSNESVPTCKRSNVTTNRGVFMKLKFAVLPGDGIGPDVTYEAVKVVGAVAARFGHEIETAEYPIGGLAIDQTGEPLPRRTIEGALAASAVLLGAVGGPRYDG